MPSWGLFQEQDQAYQDTVLPPAVTARVAVEAGTTFGWEKWVGSQGMAVGVDHFGASAPWQVLYEEFGISTARVVEVARSLVQG
jgi:transketolase